MDDFFNKRLAPLVDTSVSPWRFKPTPDAPARGSAALAQFERAAKIRDAFFRGGGQAVSFRLDFKPLELDAGIVFRGAFRPPGSGDRRRRPCQPRKAGHFDVRRSVFPKDHAEALFASRTGQPLHQRKLHAETDDQTTDRKSVV